VYTAAKLKRFYELHYHPGNAVLTIIGDIDQDTVLTLIAKYFSKLKRHNENVHRFEISEPKQEGVRRTNIARPSETNILALGVKHPGFPSKAWFETMLLFSILGEGPESILQKAFVDTGKLSSISTTIEPTLEENLGILYLTLSKKLNHEKAETEVLKCIRSCTQKDISRLLKKVQARTITDELFSRESSLKIAMELTEYISANAWERFFETEKMLLSITPHDIMVRRGVLFDEHSMTIGYFVGNEGKN
jgi:predicted Zn-dependent peptidase